MLCYTSPVVSITDATLEEWIVTYKEVMTSELKQQPCKYQLVLIH